MLAFARNLILLAVLATLAGCGEPPVERRTLMAFGTLVEVQGATEDADAFSRAMGEIEREFQRMHRDLHAWKPGMLVDLNKAIDRGERFCVSEEIATLIRRSAEIETMTGGRFNAAIGKLIALWGFHTDDPLTGAAPPSYLIVAELLSEKPSATDLSIDADNCVTSSNPSVWLDFGGIAKGHAVDVAVGILRAHGIEDALINAGGDLKVIGMRFGKPWRVAVRHPDREEPVAHIDVLEDEAVFTSGNYERYNEHEGVRYAHIIDPKRGRPVEGVASATVIHPDAVLADAMATAMVVAGVNRWRGMAWELDLEQVMLLDEDIITHTLPTIRERMKMGN